MEISSRGFFVLMNKKVATMNTALFLKSIFTAKKSTQKHPTFHLSLHYTTNNITYTTTLYSTTHLHTRRRRNTHDTVPHTHLHQAYETLTPGIRNTLHTYAETQL